SRSSFAALRRVPRSIRRRQSLPPARSYRRSGLRLCRSLDRRLHRPSSRLPLPVPPPKPYRRPPGRSPSPTTTPRADRPLPPPRVASHRSPSRHQRSRVDLLRAPLQWPDPDRRRAPATNDGALPYFVGNCSSNLLLGRRRGSSPSPRLADLQRQRESTWPCILFSTLTNRDICS
uniref:Uncharacterized protein n=1 Tax=Oryza glumipatula TaxID=40148 RepID=A0A0E0AKF1_9ORYZ